MKPLFDQFWARQISAFKGAIKIAESLQQEQPDKYETALEKAREWMPNVNQGGHAILIDIFPELGEGLDPRYGGRKQEQPEVDIEKEYAEFVDADPVYSKLVNGVAGRAIARHFAEWGAILLNANAEN